MAKGRPGGRRKENAAAPKRPFEVETAVERLREAVRPYPKAALFELSAEGHGSLFEILVACIISIRTLDEVTLPVARQLFARARTPADLVKLSPDEIDELIGACNYHEPKAKQIHEIARRTVAEFGGTLPGDADVLMSFHGVGPKCANLALGIVCNLPLIGVDVHVQRVTNRWGLVHESTPEKTMGALQKKLPQPYWVEINALLVPFGKHICTGTAPMCSTCPLLDMCRQVGVTQHR
ncbi:MAG: endonuclease III [Planctomycetes bacterium]|nr:endonuclease III [Planctomycetota bacterium]